MALQPGPKPPEGTIKIMDFLRALVELSHQHGVMVHGCGCCGSPIITAIGEKKLDGGYSFGLSDDGLIISNVDWMTQKELDDFNEPLSERGKMAYMKPWKGQVPTSDPR